jgi:hypothetical protein
MADSLTSIFSLVKPEVNVSTTWPTSLNGDLDTLDDLLARPKQTFNSPTVGATVVCDLSLARVFVFTVSQATTLSFTNPPTASFAAHVDLLVTNGSAFVLTVPGSVTWIQGVAPSLQAAGFDHIRLTSKDAGVTWYAYHVGPNLSITRNFKSGYGTAAAQAKPAQLLFASTGTTGSTGEISLTSFSLPANALPTNNDLIRIKVYGNAVTQAAQLRIKFGASYVLNIGGGNNLGAGNVFQGECVVRRSGAATQTSQASLLVAATVAASERATPAETLSGAITVDIRGNTAAGGGVINVDAVTIEILGQ